MPGLSIPLDFPLTELVGQELSNLSIGRHYLMLSFIQLKILVANSPKYGNGARIEIEAGFEYRPTSGAVVKAHNQDLAAPAAYLLPLLGQSITRVERLPNNELWLQFGDLGALILTVDEQGYESYHLHVAGDSVDVTKEF
ncbi:hypothetical protein [Pseudoduganella sp. RAF53_2]|uniref:hypothetical protein n=1 Tax=unclassified Pseudoduganella TaxID=2637179 RepID=UPI003F96953C